jgi:hypothetical protein
MDTAQFVTNWDMVTAQFVTNWDMDTAHFVINVDSSLCCVMSGVRLFEGT